VASIRCDSNSGFGKWIIVSFLLIGCEWLPGEQTEDVLNEDLYTPVKKYLVASREGSLLLEDYRMDSTKKAVVLLSGGLDSATCLAIAKNEGFDPYAITFRYGQRHAAEIEAARRTAREIGVREHVIVDIDLRLFGGSALTSDLAVPKGRPIEEMSDGIPITYVPARNTIFLSFALAWAEVLGAADIFIGVNALDYSGYPDCRPEYIAAYQSMANLATRESVEGRLKIKLHTPLINLTKAETISRGLELGVDYSHTSSCYDPGPAGEACGKCDACQLRLRGFREHRMTDPAAYVEYADA
jgi:7-cyano-7-deazaguanine synthase